VIVLIVNENSILALKLKRQTPVSANADRPVTFEFSGQRVKAPSRCIHVSRLPRVIKGKQLQAELTSVLRLNPCFRSGVKESLRASMPEAFDHLV